jgi:hypothetical protein
MSWCVDPEFKLVRYSGSDGSGIDGGKTCFEKANPSCKSCRNASSGLW